MSACTSYRAGETVCNDGFVQKPFCGGRVGRVCCGYISENEWPFCLRDDLPAHMSHDDGSPRFYRQETPND